MGPYRSWYPIVDGVETITNRLACCGAGVDQTDERTGERLHLPDCPLVARAQQIRGSR